MLLFSLCGECCCQRVFSSSSSIEGRVVSFNQRVEGVDAFLYSQSDGKELRFGRVHGHRLPREVLQSPSPEAF